MSNYDGPRCYQHQSPTYHGVSAQGDGLPAHTLGTAAPGLCRRCGGAISTGQRYLCSNEEPGIIHVPPCPTPALHAGNNDR